MQHGGGGKLNLPMLYGKKQRNMIILCDLKTKFKKYIFPYRDTNERNCLREDIVKVEMEDDISSYIFLLVTVQVWNVTHMSPLRNILRKCYVAG